MRNRTPPDVPDAFDNVPTLNLSVHLSSNSPKTIQLVAVLDTASEVNLISAEAARGTGLPWLKAPRQTLYTLSGPLQELGQIAIRFNLGQESAKSYTGVFHILPSPYFDVLLGGATIRRAGIVIRNIHAVPQVQVGDSSSEASAALSGSTLVPTNDPLLVTAIDEAVANSAQILSEESQIKPLHVAAVLRLDGAVFESNLSSLLYNFSRDLSKNASSASERGVAWLMKNKRAAIAHNIRIRFVPEDEEERQAMASLQAGPSAQMEHLHRFLEQRFRESSSGVNDDPVDNPVPDLEQDDDEAEDIPSADIFGSINHLISLLTPGEQYKRFRDNYRLFIFPYPRDVINKVLGAHLSADREHHCITCRIKCEILECLEETFGDTTDFSSIMTITGQPSHAILSKAGQYLRDTWSIGGNMADALDAILASQEPGKACASWPSATNSFQLLQPACELVCERVLWASYPCPLCYIAIGCPRLCGEGSHANAS
jgi:hypothetical protein